MNIVQPIRDSKKIAAMKAQLHSIDNKYEFMFNMGINTGLRVSDILALKVSDVIRKDHVSINEKKTGKTKRFFLNSKMQKEIAKYIKDNNLCETDYLIQSRKGKNRPVGRVQAYRVLNNAADVLGLEEIGTHTMRKTFGYHYYQRTHDVAMLMDIFNHSAPSITLRYIGINDDLKDETLKYFYL